MLREGATPFRATRPTEPHEGRRASGVRPNQDAPREATPSRIFVGGPTASRATRPCSRSSCNLRVPRGSHSESQLAPDFRIGDCADGCCRASTGRDELQIGGRPDPGSPHTRACQPSALLRVLAQPLGDAPKKVLPLIRVYGGADVGHEGLRECVQNSTSAVRVVAPIL